MSLVRAKTEYGWREGGRERQKHSVDPHLLSTCCLLITLRSVWTAAANLVNTAHPRHVITTVPRLNSTTYASKQATVDPDHVPLRSALSIACTLFGVPFLMSVLSRAVRPILCPHETFRSVRAGRRAGSCGRRARGSLRHGNICRHPGAFLRVCAQDLAFRRHYTVADPSFRPGAVRWLGCLGSSTHHVHATHTLSHTLALPPSLSHSLAHSLTQETTPGSWLYTHTLSHTQTPSLPLTHPPSLSPSLPPSLPLTHSLN